ncbi:unnamed protein product [Ophioblennius macclurei]
MIFVQRGGL